MIVIRKSPTADTRTCDFANTQMLTLLRSSRQHIEDVNQGLAFFVAKLLEAGRAHDRDKIDDIAWFHADFVHGFTEPDWTTWWERHRKINRHHLNIGDGVPDDVNLVDVLDYITDCVMAGMARSGSVYELKIDLAVLLRAFQNTVDLLKTQVHVADVDVSEP